MRSPKFNAINFWLQNHLRAILAALGSLYRAPAVTLVTWLVIGITLSLPLGLFLIVDNFEKINHHWQGKSTLTLYVKKSLSPSQVQDLQTQLNHDAGIAKTTLIPATEGLKQFAAVLQIQTTTPLLTTNPLPDVLIITPTLASQRPLALKQLAKRLQEQPGVEQVALDQTWSSRLYYLTQMAKRLCLALALLFGAGMVLITCSSLRLSLQNQQQDILVLRLVGATHNYILRPILYRGLLYGLIGGLFAWLILGAASLWLQQPSSAFFATYQLTLSQFTPGASFVVKTILLSGLLGLTGAWLAAYRHLKAPEVIA